MEVNPQEFKKRVSQIKLVKPFLGDYILNSRGDQIELRSSDRRHHVYTSISVPSHGESEGEYFVPLDRLGLIDVTSNGIKLSLTDKTATFKFNADSTHKSASFKKRSESSKKNSKIEPPTLTGKFVLNKKQLEFIFKSVSASALVRETKTEEDMRINQVHFYGSENSAVSNARFYATYVYSPVIKTDFSLVSSDLILAKNFASTCVDQIEISDSEKNVYFTDLSTGSWLSCAKVQSVKPPFSTLEIKDPQSSFVVLASEFKELIKWSSMAVEGTSRIGLSLNVDGNLTAVSNGNDLYSMKVARNSGSFLADFPISVLQTVLEYCADGEILCEYNFDIAPDILRLTQEVPDSGSAKHFIRSMKGK